VYGIETYWRFFEGTPFESFAHNQNVGGIYTWRKSRGTAVGARAASPES
jgi:hypothetical protein